MGKSFSSPAKFRLPGLRCKFLFIGDHGVGKSSLVSAFHRCADQTNDFEIPEEGRTCQVTVIQDHYLGQEVSLVCMDSLNEEDLELDCRLLAIQNTDVCILVTDNSDSANAARISNYIQVLEQHNYQNTLFVVGNKRDIGSQARSQTEEMLEDYHGFPIEHHIVSVKTGKRVKRLFDRVKELGLARHIRWFKARPFLFVHSHCLLEPPTSNVRSKSRLANLCEALPTLMTKRRSKSSFPLQRLSSNQIKEIVGFL